MTNNSSENNKIEIKKNPTEDVGLKAGMIINTPIGEGVIIGFSNISDNPIIYIYSEQKEICFNKWDLIW